MWPIGKTLAIWSVIGRCAAPREPGPRRRRRRREVQRPAQQVHLAGAERGPPAAVECDDQPAVAVDAAGDAASLRLRRLAARAAARRSAAPERIALPPRPRASSPAARPAVVERRQQRGEQRLGLLALAVRASPRCRAAPGAARRGRRRRSARCPVPPSPAEAARLDQDPGQLRELLAAREHDVVRPLDERRPRSSEPGAASTASQTATAAASGSSRGAGRSTSEASSELPGGADQRRPWRPRPAVCSEAVTSDPCGAPAAASSRARSLVESVRRRCRRGRPSGGRLGPARRRASLSRGAHRGRPGARRGARPRADRPPSRG